MDEGRNATGPKKNERNFDKIRKKSRKNKKNPNQNKPRNPKNLKKFSKNDRKLYETQDKRRKNKKIQTKINRIAHKSPFGLAKIFFIPMPQSIFDIKKTGLNRIFRMIVQNFAQFLNIFFVNLIIF